MKNSTRADRELAETTLLRFLFYFFIFYFYLSPSLPPSLSPFLLFYPPPHLPSPPTPPARNPTSAVPPSSSDLEKGATLSIGGATVLEVRGVIPLETDRWPLNLISHDSRGSSRSLSSYLPPPLFEQGPGIKGFPPCTEKLRFHRTSSLFTLVQQPPLLANGPSF